MLLLHAVPTCTEDGLDPLQLALLYIVFLSSTGVNTPIALVVIVTHCNVCLRCFPWTTSILVHLLMYILMPEYNVL